MAAAAAKLPKDKHGSNPRLTPRPTAASAARAARNATNRNISQIAPSRQSPTRNPSASTAKVKSPGSRPPPPPKVETKPEVAVPPPVQDADVSIIGENIIAIQEVDPFIVDKPSLVILEESPEDCGNKENEIPINESLEPKRPPTPVLSRPQTPKPASNFSRPNTPLLTSRPSTPVHPQRDRHQPAISRPNTPLKCPAKSPTSAVNSSPTRVQTPNSISSQPRSSLKEDDDLKTAFIAKQKQFYRMKKELDLKQQSILEVFDCLRGLSERLSRDGSSGGGEGFQIQELVVFNVGDWPSEEVAQLCRDAAAASDSVAALDVINSPNFMACTLAELDNKVSKVPSCFADLCLQAFTARQELIDWVKELIGRTDDGCGEAVDRIARYNSQGFELCETLRELKSRADEALENCTKLSKRAVEERNTLMSVGESLVREIARLRQDLDTRTVIVNEMREIRAETDAAKSLEEARRELEEERSAKAVIKEKLATAEAQLRQSRIRVSKMDRQLREAETSIASLTGTVKSLEDQSRQREVHLEARARKLKESLKTGEVTSNQLVQQRDLLQTEVQNLKDQIETMNSQHKTIVQDLIKEVKELKMALEQQRQMTQEEVELRKAAESKLAEYFNLLEELKAKNLELENNKPNPELPTEREMDLWAELQATKDTLRIAEEEVNVCKREKVRFLETLTKIAETENKVGMQQKLAAELLTKEELVSKMQIQIRELTKNIKLNEQKVIQYEQYVRNLQAHTRAVANCQEAPDGISYEDLQQEIMNLRMSLLEAVHRNEDLSEALTQKEQQLESQDKTSRAQARVIKVREELINMLKNKETEQTQELTALQQDLEHRMKIVDEVNKQIAAKAEEIQELFTTLENKQQQIHRLEKIVLALDEQQRRAQAQRTRHEEKIAELEHELAAGNRRERKFIFF